MGRDQLLGSFTLLFLAALFLLVPSPARSPHEPSRRETSFSTRTPGTIAVELTGDTGRNGIYFIPRGTTLEGFLDLAGVERAGVEEANRKLPVFTSATTVHLSTATQGVSVGTLPAEKRLALGLPIDLNRSTRDELVFVPGIGEKTADRILEQRGIMGSFRRLEDLMQVKGIKEKRLAKLRPYLCIGC